MKKEEKIKKSTGRKNKKKGNKKGEKKRKRSNRDIRILGVKISKYQEKNILAKIKKWIKKSQRRQICTVNPEFIISAQENNEFKKVLNKSDINTPDGIGVRAAAKFKELPKSDNKLLRFFQTIFQGFFIIAPSIIVFPGYLNIIPQTITGVNLTKKIAELSSKNKLSVFFLGAMPGVAEKAAKKIKKEYPGFEIAGCYAGSPNKKEEKKIIKMVNKADPDILLVAYGAPKQDIWINRNVKKLKKPIIAMGVGGTFDFLAGKLKRAPKWMRSLNLEWLFRLFQEPKKRMVRIYTAAVIFPWLVWKDKMKQPKK